MAEVVEGDVVDRRIFVALTGAALTTPALTWLIAPDAGDVSGAVGRQVHSVHLDEIEAMTDRLRRMDDGSPRVRAILDLRVAEAHAQVGDADQCRAAIDEGYGALRDARPDDADPPWSYWLDEAQVNAQAGYCFIRLGDWSRAQHHLGTALRLQEHRYGREAALRRALLAVAYAGQGDPEQACQVAGAAVDALAEDVDSPRCVGHIRRVQECLAPYRRVPAVTAFHERVDHTFGSAGLGLQ